MVDFLNLKIYSTNMMKIISRNTIRGIGSIMVMHPAKNRYVIKKRLPQMTDSECLRNDWLKVGQTLQKAITTVNNGKK